MGLTGLAGCNGLFDDGDSPAAGTERNDDGDKTVLADFEDGTLDGWTGSDNLHIIETDAAVGTVTAALSSMVRKSHQNL